MLDCISWLKSGLLILATGAVARGNEIRHAHAPVPVVDRWMYSFNATAGSRTTASTFSALPGDGGVDDRFGQFLLKFDTVAADIPAGLGPENYQPEKLVLTTVLAPSENIPYDPTEDPRSSYGPSATADPDSGRPLELHGTGFRGGFTAATFLENSAFGSSDPGMRNAHALGFTPQGEPRDVSRNLTLGFDARPWAIGKVIVPSEDETTWLELSPGDPIPAYARAVFELDLTLPGVADYVRTSLDQGFIWLAVTSLHSVTQQAAAGYPSYFTKEHPEQALFGDVASSLDVDFSLPFRITAFSREGSVSRLKWNASPGFQYHVQDSPDLRSSTWQNLAEVAQVTSIPGHLSFEIPQSGDRRFFRVVRTPLP